MRSRVHGAAQVIDYTTTAVADAVTEPVDVVLNLVRTSPEETADLVSLVKPGGVFVSTTTPGVVPPGADLRTVSIFVRSDAAQLDRLAQLVDAGELRVDVSARHPLEELATVHALGEAGKLRGKVVLTPTPNGERRRRRPAVATTVVGSGAEIGSLHRTRPTLACSATMARQTPAISRPRPLPDPTARAALASRSSNVASADPVSIAASSTQQSGSFSPDSTRSCASRAALPAGGAHSSMPSDASARVASSARPTRVGPTRISVSVSVCTMNSASACSRKNAVARA